MAEPVVVEAEQVSVEAVVPDPEVAEDPEDLIATQELVVVAEAKVEEKVEKEEEKVEAAEEKEEEKVEEKAEAKVALFRTVYRNAVNEDVYTLAHSNTKVSGKAAAQIAEVRQLLAVKAELEAEVEAVRAQTQYASMKQKSA
jgi:hypothetical protein